MKLLHFADLHLGIERHGQTDPETGLSTRLLDFLRALDQIVEAAIAERVDAVLFAGDAYKNRDPAPTIQREFARRLRRLVEADIPTVILIGNHDLPNAWGRATALDIFSALAVPGVVIADQIAGHLLQTRAGPLQLVTLPWITRSHVLARDEFRAASMEEAQQLLLEAIAGLLAREAAALDPDLPAVLLAHATLHGATFGIERSVMLGQDLVFTRSDLSAEAYDYVALGHIHKHQAVGANPPAVYSGSPERIDFGEEAEAKGYILVEIGTGPRGARPLDWRFCPLPARPFRTLTLQAFGSDPQGDLLRSIERAPDLAGAIVRLIVALAPEAEGQVRPVELRRALRAAGVAQVASIRLESEAVARARLPLAGHEELSPEQMLARYLEAKRVPTGRAQRLLELARTLRPEEAPRPKPAALLAPTD